ncbi:MAG: tetratricopeptide repeat protein [Verrucomicrobiota bacterium]
MKQKKSLPYPDGWHVKAALGWLMLGNPVEAEMELNRVSPEMAHQPEVQALRCRFFIARKQWQEALHLAVGLLKAAPERIESWVYPAYCLHELGRTAEAFRLLKPAARRFPQNHLIPLNLACYCWHLHDFRKASRWLDRASVVLR